MGATSSKPWPAAKSPAPSPDAHAIDLVFLAHLCFGEIMPRSVLVAPLGLGSGCQAALDADSPDDGRDGAQSADARRAASSASGDTSSSETQAKLSTSRTISCTE